MPFTWGQIMELGSDGNTNCWKTENIKSYQDFLNSECIWFAELGGAAHAGQGAPRIASSSTTT